MTRKQQRCLGLRQGSPVWNDPEGQEKAEKATLRRDRFLWPVVAEAKLPWVEE